MEDYAQIYWLDPRNADSRDHRAQGSVPMGSVGPGMPTTRPGTMVPGGRYPAATYPVRPAYPVQSYGQAYPGQPMVGPPMMTQPIAVMQPATYFGGFTIGQIVEMAAQALAALQPLPGAPTATSDVGTDVGNLILYQSAIAQHAKRDEQVRTLGSLISKLVK